MTDTPAIGSVRSSSSPPEAGPPPPQPLLPERSPTPEPSPSLSERDPLRRTRSSSLWTGLIVFGVVLVLLSVFILQNTQSVRISYFAATGDVSLAVAMLLATAAGVLLAAIAG